MMTRYCLTLQACAEHPLYPDAAYRLYAHLLEQLPPEAAEYLHEAGGRAITQHLQYRKKEEVLLWTVHILSEQIGVLLAPVLENLEQVFVENHTFPVLRREKSQLTLEQLLEPDMTTGQSVITFCTPTAFRQNGRYTIFPQERLILQSLINRWNEVFPHCALEDADAFEAMLTGIHIVDYQLRSGRFSLKGVRIPGFTGYCVLDARLAPPLLALWNTLLAFAPYAGIGIKTGIGMGAVQVRPREKYDNKP